MLKVDKKLERNSNISKVPFVPITLSIPELSSSRQGSSLSRAPSVPVLGRKLSSESIITVNEDLCNKYPLAIDLIPKKTFRVIPMSKPASVTKLKKKSNTVKILEQPIVSNSSRKSSVLIKSKTCTKLVKKNNKTETSKHCLSVKSPKSPENGLILKSLLCKSLKHHKRIKRLAQKKERIRKEAKNRLKNEVKTLSIVAREDNLKNFKAKIFKPKYPWGVDEKRLEKSSERRKGIEQSEKIFQRPLKRLKVYRKSLVTYTPDIFSHKKCQHTSRPEIKTYLKQKQISRKRSKENEENEKFEKENRRILQLKYIDVISKQIVEKQHKKIKKKKTPKKILKRCPPIKWVQRDLEDFSESNRDEHKKNFSNSGFDNIERQSNHFGYYPSSDVAKSELNSGRSSNFLSKMPPTDVFVRKPTEFPTANTNQHITSPKSPNSLNLNAKRQKKHQKQEELTKKFEIAKHKMNGFKISKEKAILRIQAAVRGWLVRKNINKLILKRVAFDDSNSWMYRKQYPESPESFNEEDDEVKKILGVFQINNNDAHSSPLMFKDKKENLRDFSPIFKGENLSLSDIDNQFPKEQVLNELQQKDRKNQKVERKTLKPKPEFIPNSIQKSPSCELNEKTQEKTINLFKYILEIQLKTIYTFSVDIKNRALDLLKTFLQHNDKNSTQFIHQTLENISNRLTLPSFLKFIKEIPELKALLNENNRLELLIASNLPSHNSPEQSFSIPSFPTAPLHHPSIDQETLPLFPIFQVSSSYDLFSDPASEAYFSLLSESVLLVMQELLIQDCIAEALDEVLIGVIEQLLIGLVHHEVSLVNQELKTGTNDESLVTYADFIFKMHGEEIFQTLGVDRREDPLELLSCMQESEIGSGSFQEYYEDVLDTQMFLETITSDPMQICIYKKAVFDCINEGLFGLSFKTSMPWSTNFLKKVENESAEEVYFKILALLLKWNTCRLGKIFTSFIAFDIGEEALHKLREERILAVLAQESKENDFKWTDYEFEETQLKLDIADMILEYLVEETMNSFIN